MRAVVLLANTSKALAWISSTPIRGHPTLHFRRFNHRRMATTPSSLQKMETRTAYIDAGANLLDSMYQGTYHGKPRHEPDLDLVLKRSYNSGVHKIIGLAGTTRESEELLALIKQLDKEDFDERVLVFGTVGIHPTRCGEEFAEKITDESDETISQWTPKSEQQQEQIMQKLITIANDGKTSGDVVAIGECGLDYARLQFCPKDIQQIGLKAQLEVAIETKLPLYLHNRESGEDLYSILLDYKERLTFDNNYLGIRGIVHSFDESIEIANQFLSSGLFIGINGCSLKTSENLDTVKDLPLESIILETDCPWCDIRPTHAGHSFIKTNYPTKKEKQYIRSVGEDFCVKNRTEPIFNITQRIMLSTF